MLRRKKIKTESNVQNKRDTQGGKLGQRSRIVKRELSRIDFKLMADRADLSGLHFHRHRQAEWIADEVAPCRCARACGLWYY